MVKGVKKKGDKKSMVYDKYSTIRILTATVERIREYKEETGIPITSFIEDAIDEKFKRLKL